jgi:hypothetical protein
LYDASNTEQANVADDISLTQKSDMEDDEDKVLFQKIGKTEISIDKVLSNLLNGEVSNDDDSYGVGLYNSKEHCD